MNKFKPNDKVILKSEENKKNPLVMIVFGRITQKIPPNGILNELGNVLNIADDQEVYLCQWIFRKKPKSGCYDADSLVLFT